jgi:hypothetical protein
LARPSPEAAAENRSVPPPPEVEARDSPTSWGLAAPVAAPGTVDNAIADFSARYADQNQRDYDTFVKAIADGRIQSVTGI